MKKAEMLAAVSAIGLVGSVSSSEAFSVVSRDAQPHVLQILEGDEQREVKLEPYGQASNLCRSACDVSIDDGPDLYEVAASDALTIEDGELFGPEDEAGESMIDDPPEQPIEDPS